MPGGIEICLYVQGTGGLVHQAVYSPQNPGSGWAHGVTSLPVMPFGMSLACTYLAGQAHRRIYTFNGQNQLMEYGSADGKTWTGNGTSVKKKIASLGLLTQYTGSPYTYVRAPSCRWDRLCRLAQSWEECHRSAFSQHR